MYQVAYRLDTREDLIRFLEEADIKLVRSKFVVLLDPQRGDRGQCKSNSLGNSMLDFPSLSKGAFQE